MRKQRQIVLALVAGVLFLSVGAIGVSASVTQTGNKAHPVSLFSSAKSNALDLASSLGIGEDEGQVAPGTLDDGKDLLPQAQITIDEAIAAAQAAYPGTPAEIDLEHYKGHLVFNVDSDGKDVKVDAINGTVLGAESDD